MKRSEMLEGLEITVRLARHKFFSDAEMANVILNYIENLGMLPPSIRISTPLGPRIFFDTNEWEEKAKYDQEGFPLEENDERK